MTDLSLHEYGDTLKDDLQKILRQEAMKMFGSTCPKKIIQPRVNASPGLIHHLRYFSRRVFANSLGYFF
ncbi:MAG: hypothetical protein JW932_17315 [Deltaproteobacteria bacterium]|nr:hypothetical protein [Deltaproteobacteria bacterium]